MIEESMEIRRHQEEVMRERARREEERRASAVLSLQAATRGYLTRKKTTPMLVALRERKRRERERERQMVQAATAIQAVWRGYRWVTDHEVLSIYLVHTHTVMTVHTVSVWSTTLVSANACRVKYN